MGRNAIVKNTKTGETILDIECIDLYDAEIAIIKAISHPSDDLCMYFDQTGWVATKGDFECKVTSN